ncbi:MAG: tRNA pseudouridine(54/55) synthase Pus10 [Candidatus Diapherotrites archaeon]|nr:tRNA pseudouridine(54/55) synthase Pus10 [Candidatus Diapherotrites archaeon]
MEKIRLCERCTKRYSRIPKEEIATTNEKECPACRNIFSKKKEMMQLVEKTVKEYEFDNFLLGCILPDKIIDFETEMIEKYEHEDQRSIKQDINQEIGSEFEKRWKKEVNFTNPEIMIILDYIGNKVKLQIKPVYIYGRYNKYERGLPQTKWPCRKCRGRGCKQCNNTGKQYGETLEELVAVPFVEASQAKNESFHGGGREDIDAVMLGTGRPFVLELIDPKIRKIDLKKLEKVVNEKNKDRVAIHDLEFTEKKKVVDIKAAKHDKTYIALTRCSESITNSDIAKINKIKDMKLEQYTPKRVENRRAKLTRERTVYYVKAERVERDLLKLEIKAETGTYIKEFISSDNGRTKPSITEIIGKPCICEALDVINIEG